MQPPEIEALPLEYIEILNMPFAPDQLPGSFDLEETQSTFNKALLQTTPTYNSKELLLVNGGSQPVIAMEKNQWYRFRIGYFSSYHNLWTVIKDAQDWMPGVNESRSSRCFRRRRVVPQSQAAWPRGRFYAP